MMNGKKKIKLTRVKNHFIFSIESVGILPPHIIFQEAIKVFKKKVEVIKEEILSFKNSE